MTESIPVERLALGEDQIPDSREDLRVCLDHFVQSQRHLVHRLYQLQTNIPMLQDMFGQSIHLREESHSTAYLGRNGMI